MEKDLSVLKCDFRRDSIATLKLSSRYAKIKKDKFICSQILELIKSKKIKNILAYIPLNQEVNILPLINELRKKSKYNIFVPFMKGDSFIPVKYRLPLEIKKFGIKEPKFSNLKTKIDLAIVPIVGVDETLRRIGFGAGMYDRYFDRLGYKPITLFTQLTLCKSDKIVTSSHDIKADYIITFN